MYDDSFYEMINDGSYKSAQVVIPLVLQAFKDAGLEKPRTVVDFGCGQGAWLKGFKEHGVEVYGLDGGYVDRSKLLIEDSEFKAIDFDKDSFSISFGRHLWRDGEDSDKGKWDLAISLEVAEHVAPENADDYIRLVAGSADVILFSAAIPGQGGVGHVNEQWPDYWVQKFQVNGFKYVSDFIRKETWNNADVEPWYKQNTLLLSKQDMHLPQGWDSVVHPIVWDHVRGAG